MEETCIVTNISNTNIITVMFYTHISGSITIKIQLYNFNNDSVPLRFVLAHRILGFNNNDAAGLRK